MQALDERGWQHRPDEDVVDSGLEEIHVVALRPLIDEGDDRDAAGAGILAQGPELACRGAGMPAAIKKDCAGIPLRADLQAFVDAARHLGDEALRLEPVVEQQIEVDVAGADHDERFFLRLTATLPLPYHAHGHLPTP